MIKKTNRNNLEKKKKIFNKKVEYWLTVWNNNKSPWKKASQNICGELKMAWIFGRHKKTFKRSKQSLERNFGETVEPQFKILQSVDTEKYSTPSSEPAFHIMKSFKIKLISKIICIFQFSLYLVFNVLFFNFFIFKSFFFTCH